ncbi:OmpH family outer membrane protein [bacterium]|nr:OmpH family outer membrane protein [bacterium]
MKFGHINSQVLLEAMPEKAEADKALEAFAAQLEKQLQTMSTEWDSKVQDYRANEAVMSDIIAQTKAEEIQQLEQRIQSFQQNAQQSIGKKEAEVYQPILDKAKEAIEAVSKEGSYNYVFDSSSGSLLYQPDGDDIIELVKKKLGITGPPPAPME